MNYVAVGEVVVPTSQLIEILNGDPQKTTSSHDS